MMNFTRDYYIKIISGEFNEGDTGCLNFIKTRCQIRKIIGNAHGCHADATDTVLVHGVHQECEEIKGLKVPTPRMARG